MKDKECKKDEKKQRDIFLQMNTIRDKAVLVENLEFKN
jgi:hypothetical protein